jgi:hypothetical protein
MPTLRIVPRYERATERAMTESWSTSECRCRFERHRRADRPHRQLSLARGEAHERLNLRSQGRDHASGLERRIFEPRHPSVVSERRVLATLRLPESPNPHRFGFDPAAACAYETRIT